MHLLPVVVRNVIRRSFALMVIPGADFFIRNKSNSGLLRVEGSPSATRERGRTISLTYIFLVGSSGRLLLLKALLTLLGNNDGANRRGQVLTSRSRAFGFRIHPALPDSSLDEDEAHCKNGCTRKQYV